MLMTSLDIYFFPTAPTHQFQHLLSNNDTFTSLDWFAQLSNRTSNSDTEWRRCTITDLPENTHRSRTV